MNNLFDKTFFKFTVGFILIILASFAVMAFSGVYQSSIDASIGNTNISR